MYGNVMFEYDMVWDFVIAKLHWKFEIEKDVTSWYGRYEAFFKRFGRKKTGREGSLFGCDPSGRLTYH